MLDELGYARIMHWRVYGEEGLARCEVALWLGNDGLTVEFGGEMLSRYDAEYQPGDRRLRELKRPRLFATRFRSPQLKLFGLEALGEEGWLRALRLEAYALRRRQRPQALQQTLFVYTDAI